MSDAPGEDPRAFTALRARVDELEAQAGFQDRTLGRLDEVLREFTRRVETLEAEAARLRAQLAAGPDEGAPAEEDQD